MSQTGSSALEGASLMLIRIVGGPFSGSRIKSPAHLEPGLKLKLKSGDSGGSYELRLSEAQPGEIVAVFVEAAL